MGEYETTLKDIEKTLGMVPGFMKAIPKDVLVQDWPLMKKYQLGETQIPAKYREFIGLAISANIKCPYCSLMHTAMATFNGATGKGPARMGLHACAITRCPGTAESPKSHYDTFAKE